MAERADRTETITAVPVLRVGRFTGARGPVEFSPADLDRIVEAFDSTGEAIPARLQLGHGIKQELAKALGLASADVDGWPAVGWIKRLRRKGDALLADWTDVPTRLADMIRDGRYAGRSVGLRANVEHDGKVWPWLLDHVALLGDQRPAVPDLGAIGLSAAEGVEVFTLAAGPDGAPDDATELDALMTELDALLERIAPYIAGRRGAPRTRQLFSAFRADLKRAARTNLEGTDDMDLTKLAAALDAKATDMGGLVTELAGADDVVPRIERARRKLAKRDEGVDVELMDFGSAEEFVQWLASHLSAAMGEPVMATDLAKIADAVADALGAPDPAAADPAADPAAPMPEDENMSDNAPATEIDVALAARDERIARLEAELNSTRQDLATVTIDRQREAAERRVDADIAEHHLPAGLRATLVELASADNDGAYRTVIEHARRVPVGERGTSAQDDVQLAALSAADRAAARAMGIKPETIAAQRKADAERAKASA